TKKVETDETIELLVSGVSDDKKLKEMLTSLDGVRSADITFNETDKTHKASILVKSSFDNAPEVAQKIISSNLKLHKMNTVELSLEEAFLRLVNSMKGDEQK
ncbi:MAG TPA: hypothetical protein PKW98_17695, partial [Candidatus Wallbacteria bacterium]|nr:hypothetical protein [Candidatus Wallbacteria bacterium]